MEPIIATRTLQYRYLESPKLFRFPDENVQSGERVAVTGRSGCGKTTLLRLLTGLIVPSSGSAHVNGEEITALSESERRRFRVSTIGTIPQELDLLEHLRLEENILLPFHINRSLKLSAAAREEATYLAEQLGLADKLRRRPAQLSQGERQRVAIARALITKPAILVADEPTGNLDGETARQVLALIARLIADRGTTFLMVTHDLSLLDHFDRRIDLNEPDPALV